MLALIVIIFALAAVVLVFSGETIAKRWQTRYYARWYARHAAIRVPDTFPIEWVHND